MTNEECRGLNEAIAREVMGWTLPAEKDAPHPHLWLRAGTSVRAGYAIDEANRSPKMRSEVWNPMERMDHAMVALREFWGRVPVFWFGLSTSPLRSGPRFGPFRESWEARLDLVAGGWFTAVCNGATAEEAICRALLTAVRQPRPEEPPPP